MARYNPVKRNIIIWVGVIAFSLVLGVTAVLYFQVRRIPVLTRDVVAGTQLTKDMYTLVDMNPRDGVLADVITDPSELFKDGNIAGTNGKFTLSTMVKGQPVPRRLITANPLDPQFGIGAEVKQGEVAIAASLDISDAIGGVVDRGSLVNVTYTSTGPSSPSSGGGFSGNSQLNTSGTHTLNGVRIIEVRTESGMLRYPNTATSSGSAMQSRTLIITFAIPAADAESFSIARASGGRFILALPSRLDVPRTGTTTSPPAAVTPSSSTTPSSVTTP